MKLHRGIALYSLPPHREIVSITIDLGKGHTPYRLVIQPMHILSASRKQDERAAGNPKYCAIEGGNLHLYPSPSQDGKMEITYVPPAKVI